MCPKTGKTNPRLYGVYGLWLERRKSRKKKSGEFELNQPNIKYSNSERFFPTYQSESEGSLTQRGAERVAHSINEAYYDESYLSLFPVLMKMKVMRCSLYRRSINGWNHLAASPPLLSPQRLWFPLIRRGSPRPVFS